MTSDQLVSVVIPAYNARATLDETLLSIRSQTHRALEIIVVDDGSSDDTFSIAERHASIDSRVQVLAQANAGVAAARNAGWRRAHSELIAFVDADDLWEATMIKRQLEILQAGGNEVGLVYCWWFLIDHESKICATSERAPWEGDVLDHIFSGNFVGNGSCIMVRRQALIDACGFDSGLRAAGAEGCEDYLLYCRVAEKYHFTLVSEPLVGYRYLPQNMSSNRIRMLRSWLLVVDEMLDRHPGRGETLRSGIRNYGGFLVDETLTARGIPQLPSLLFLLLRRYPTIGLKLLLKEVPLTLARKTRARLRRLRGVVAEAPAGPIGQSFPVGAPDPCPSAVGRARQGGSIPMPLKESN